MPSSGRFLRILAMFRTDTSRNGALFSSRRQATLEVQLAGHRVVVRGRRHGGGVTTKELRLKNSKSDRVLRAPVFLQYLTAVSTLVCSYVTAEFPNLMISDQRFLGPYLRAKRYKISHSSEAVIPMNSQLAVPNLKGESTSVALISRRDRRRRRFCSFLIPTLCNGLSQRLRGPHPLHSNRLPENQESHQWYALTLLPSSSPFLWCILRTLILIPPSDPIHGHIPLDPHIVAAIDTPQFQRLRDLKQVRIATACMYTP